jgi:hypothetical protein
MKRVSLADELAELAAVLESTQLIAELLDTHSMPDTESASRAPGMLAAVLELTRSRVTLLRQVVMQQADVSLLAGRRNQRDRVAPGEDADVILPTKQRSK